MINAEKHKETKELMCAFIRARGPSLPVHIARDVKIDPLFASAFLSELFREQRVKMSHLKVGSTALYYLPGQEAQLEQFVQYLNQREQEAHQLIKKKGVCAHHTLNPIMQIAMTRIPDFASAIEQQGVTYWHYTFLPVEELNTRLNQLTKPSVPETVPEIIPEQVTQKNETPAIPLTATVHSEEQATPSLVSEQKPVKQRNVKAKLKPNVSLPTTLSFASQQEHPRPQFPFTHTVHQFLTKNNFQQIHIQKEDKKQCTFQATKETITYTFLAKDRKKLQETDLQEAITLLQSHRTPIILVLQAPLDKKGLTLLEPWKNLIQMLSLQ